MSPETGRAGRQFEELLPLKRARELPEEARDYVLECGGTLETEVRFFNFDPDTLPGVPPGETVLDLDTEGTPWKLRYQPQDDYEPPPPCNPRTREEALASLNLLPIRRSLRARAREVLETDGVAAFLTLPASNESGVTLVALNRRQFLALDCYEAGLLHALEATRTNWGAWPLADLVELLRAADPKKLREAGDPLPEGDTFTVYRGVAGRGEEERRKRGISWTLSRDCACWFATRSAGFGFPRPAVYRATVQRRDVLAYSNWREEEEVLVLPDSLRAVKRERLTVAEIREAVAAHSALLAACRGVASGRSAHAAPARRRGS